MSARTWIEQKQCSIKAHTKRVNGRRLERQLRHENSDEGQQENQYGATHGQDNGHQGHNRLNNICGGLG